jgi:hypothetical protein
VEPDFDVIIPVAVAVALALFAVLVLVLLVRAARRRTLSPRGLAARGLVLTCDRLSTNVTVNGRRFENRRMTLDVEIPGRPPYQATGTFLVPRGIVEALPGSSLELVVDPSNMAQISVIGPGGFTGPWLSYGPPNSY